MIGNTISVKGLLSSTTSWKTLLERSSLLVFFMLGLQTSALAQIQALPKQPPIPNENPMSSAKIELGKQLFFDPRLSVDGTISCNSCHNVMAGGDDGRPVSVGVRGQKGTRGAPTVWNSAYLTVMFWDGRMASLEDQAKGPLTNPIEMGMPNHQVVTERVRHIPGFVSQFKAVFGSDKITIDQVAQAIASFERTLITPNSVVDRYLEGDSKALSEQQAHGLKLFQEKGCVACHSGPVFAGPALPPGTGFFQKFPLFADNEYVSKYQLTQDGGRFEETKVPADRGMWRVPTLRNIALTAPYFHNGLVTSLDEAVRVMAKTQLNQTLSDAEVTAIVGFLEGLTGEMPKIDAPRLPATRGTTILNIN